MHVTKNAIFINKFACPKVMTIRPWFLTEENLKKTQRLFRNSEFKEEAINALEDSLNEKTNYFTLTADTGFEGNHEIVGAYIVPRMNAMNVVAGKVFMEYNDDVTENFLLHNVEMLLAYSFHEVGENSGLFIPETNDVTLQKALLNRGYQKIPLDRGFTGEIPGIKMDYDLHIGPAVHEYLSKRFNNSSLKQ